MRGDAQQAIANGCANDTFSKVPFPYEVTLHRKYTRALTFQSFVAGKARVQGFQIEPLHFLQQREGGCVAICLVRPTVSLARRLARSS